MIGRCPYLKLVKDGENFTINGRPETETTFEDYMREYLNTHEDKNNSGLPIVSGAVGYFPMITEENRWEYHPEKRIL